MLKMMQKLSNRIIDLEKEKEAHKAYKPYYKKENITTNSRPLRTVQHQWIDRGWWIIFALFTTTAIAEKNCLNVIHDIDVEPCGGVLNWLLYSLFCSKAYKLYEPPFFLQIYYSVG